MEKIHLRENKYIVNSNSVEYYNALKTNIQFLGKDIQVMSITSVSANEGKSVVSLNLAISLAQDNLRVLYIDADTRNSAFAGRFKLSGPVQGLTNFLSGVCQFSEIFHTTDIPGLDIVLSGRFPPNPTALLKSKTFIDFIHKSKKYYNYVIIDTPPLGLVIDAAIVARVCDGTILVTQAGKIKRHHIGMAIHQLELTGVPFLGVILNKLNISNQSYGFYGSYGNYDSRDPFEAHGSYKKFSPEEMRENEIRPRRV